MDNKYKKLLKCIALDAIGMSTLAIPGIGAFLDAVWAPIAASISYKMFGNKRGKYTSLITFIEELLPGTDAVPSFTIFCILFDFIGLGKDDKVRNAVTDVDYTETR
jgi:hypothetical protein